MARQSSPTLISGFTASHSELPECVTLQRIITSTRPASILGRTFSEHPWTEVASTRVPKGRTSGISFSLAIAHFVDEFRPATVEEQVPVWDRPDPLSGSLFTTARGRRGSTIALNESRGVFSLIIDLLASSKSWGLLLPLDWMV
ncbi:hypothetical protein SUNI508_08998 [Seiridium unicorne]|uniref:Uncharacterized protein n=1 Tax=Seiridium unicorne TaxID=138068 RepID=A0ABR2US87_9PEZI